MSLRIVTSGALALALYSGTCPGQPASAGAAPATPAPATPAPATSAPVPATYVRFADAELLLGDRVANPYAPNLTGSITNSLRAGAEYRFLGRNFAEFEYRRWSVDHPAGFVTQPLTLAQAFVPARRFSEQDVFFNSSLYGLGHTYVATSSLVHSTNEGGPTLHADLGFGLERLPDPTRPLSLYGSYYYYPDVSGKLAEADGSRPAVSYKLETFRLGGSLAIPRSRFFLTANLLADHYLRKANAPGNATHTSASLGIGFHG